MHASWPETGKVDPSLVRQSEYLDDALYDFRSRLKTYLAPKGKVIPFLEYYVVFLYYV